MKQLDQTLVKTNKNIKKTIRVLYDLTDSDSRYRVLNPKEPLIIYCKSGRRSKKSRAVFKELGFLTVYDLEGGVLNWKSEGFHLK